MMIFRDSRVVLAVLAVSAAVLAAPPAPVPAKPGAPSAQPAPPPPPEEDEGHAYVYDPAGRRDPFKSLLVRERSREGERPPGIPGLSVDELELQGLWKTRSGWIAQVRGSDNRSYLLRKGDLLFDGEVLDVRANELTLRQNVNDPQSVKPFRDVTKRLNAARPE
jgi:type IV pilus assembly protein PilP